VLDGCDEDAALLDRLPSRRLDAVELEQVRRLFDVVDDVVERGGERVDVLPVERRDVLRVQQLDQLVRQAVALVLEGFYLVMANGAARKVAEALLDAPRGLQRVVAGLTEEGVELGGSGCER
jgi:uncharacterized protein YjeT (DUF2065 family)